MECATSLKVGRFVLLHRDDGNADQIRLAHDVALEVHEVRQACLVVIVDFVAGYTDFFLCCWVLDVPGSNIRMLALCYSERSFPFHY